METCSAAELRNAGECFSLAGNYKTAAEVYAKGNFFNECLSACTKGNCFDLGLEYIEHWRLQASSDTTFIDKLSQEFLEKCGLECHKKNDKAALVKFVRAFCTIELKRSFLKSLDCLEELIILEEESANFSEAAEIAKGLGLVLREIDLLEKAEDFENASLLIRSYVLTNSIWVSQSRGWPLKYFPQKEVLLAKAVSDAKKVSKSFHASICAECETLSHDRMNLSELRQCYSASKQFKTHTGEILSVRKLLDAHFQVHASKYEQYHELHIDPRLFDERMSRNQVSIGTLFFVWNLWKQHSLQVLECLHSIERLDFDKSDDTARFCFGYFGVRLLGNLSNTCLLQNPDAVWVRDSDQRFLLWKGKVATLDARHFASAARGYWFQELVWAGLRVLEALEAHYKFWLVKPSSEYCQSMCLTLIFDIASFIIESKSFHIKNGDSRKLQYFLRLSTKYLEIAFPLDLRQLSEDMIYLRGTELSKHLLEEIISRKVINSRNDLTYRQIGEVMMIMLGSGKPKHKLRDMITARLSENSYWKPFIENLIATMESDSRRDFELVSGLLHKALIETYNINWRATDYISPNCFFYLVERLLIMVPHPRGLFFATKSSFVEYLTCLKLDANPSAGLVFDTKSYTASIFDFVVGVIRECLYNTQYTAEWIVRSSINCDYYFPLLMVRLFVILCVSCLNSELPFGILFEVMRLPQVKNHLPREFCQAIHRRRNYDLDEAAVARAFKAIGDPLVIVTSTENRLELSCPDAVFLDLSSFSCQNDAMNKLFPKSTEASLYQQVTTTTVEERNVVSEEVTSSINAESSETVSETDLESSSEHDKANLQINWGMIREMLDGLVLLRNGNDGDLKSLILRKKVIL